MGGTSCIGEAAPVSFLGVFLQDVDGVRLVFGKDAHGCRHELDSECPVVVGVVFDHDSFHGLFFLSRLCADAVCWFLHFGAEDGKLSLLFMDGLPSSEGWLLARSALVFFLNPYAHPFRRFLKMYDFKRFF